MSKILITSIGTGDIKKDSDSDYHETTYIIEDKMYTSTLTSEAIIKHYEINKVIFIGTSGSMWDNLYLKYGGEDEAYLDLLTNKKKDSSLKHQDLEPFLKQIDSYLDNNGSNCFIIDYNTSNKSDEIWNNFEMLLSIRDLIEDGDELYLDITHGFRYMPIINIFLLETLKALHSKSFSVNAILYGMFADKESEIINFKIFFDLLDWIKAINDFKRHADASHLSSLIKEDKEASNVLTQFSDALHLSNLHALWSFIKKVNEKLAKLQKTDNKIIKLLSGDIDLLAKRFDKEQQSDFQFELSKWLFEGQNYALSYILLYEAIITKSCELKGDLDCSSHDDREKAKKSLGDDKYGKFFYTKYSDSISKIRNTIVHQNKDRKDSTQQDIKRLERFLEKFENYFKIG